MLRAAIFDIDGVVDSVDLHASAWQEALIRFGHEVTFEQELVARSARVVTNSFPCFFQRPNERTMGRRWRNGGVSYSNQNISLWCDPSQRYPSCCVGCRGPG